MCSSAPKIKPTASPPIASPTVIDEAAIAERDRARMASRNRAGRSSTVLAGMAGAGGKIPTAPVQRATGG